MHDGDDASSELHLSEVSLLREGASVAGTYLYTTISFSLSPLPLSLPPTGTIMIDSDGDILLERKKLTRLTIMHEGATTLHSVGLQIWPASILLGDFFLHESAAGRMSKGCVIELGAGCSGIPSLVMAKIRPSMTQPIFVTDAHEPSLECLKVNLLANGVSHLRIRKTDWMAEDEEILVSKNLKSFGWTAEDLKDIDSEEGVTLLAADCIYDECLTEAMLDVAYKLMKRSKGSAVLYVSCEKRFTFTIRDLDSKAPAFDHFTSLLHIEDGCGIQQALDDDGGGRKKLKGRRMDITEIPLAIRVDPMHLPRSIDLLELWQVELNDL